MKRHNLFSLTKGKEKDKKIDKKNELSESNSKLAAAGTLLAIGAASSEPKQTIGYQVAHKGGKTVKIFYVKKDPKTKVTAQVKSPESASSSNTYPRQLQVTNTVKCNTINASKTSILTESESELPCQISSLPNLKKGVIKSTVSPEILSNLRRVVYVRPQVDPFTSYTVKCNTLNTTKTCILPTPASQTPITPRTIVAPELELSRQLSSLPNLKKRMTTVSPDVLSNLRRVVYVRPKVEPLSKKIKLEATNASESLKTEPLFLNSLTKIEDSKKAQNNLNKRNSMKSEPVNRNNLESNSLTKAEYIQTISHISPIKKTTRITPTELFGVTNKKELSIKKEAAIIVQPSTIPQKEFGQIKIRIVENNRLNEAGLRLSTATERNLRSSITKESKLGHTINEASLKSSKLNERILRCSTTKETSCPATILATTTMVNDYIQFDSTQSSDVEHIEELGEEKIGEDIDAIKKELAALTDIVHNLTRSNAQIFTAMELNTRLLSKYLQTFDEGHINFSQYFPIDCHAKLLNLNERIKAEPDFRAKLVRT